MIDIRKLIESGVHFGHQTSRWCPKMAPYIWGHKGTTHLIDVSKTAQGLERSARFVEQVASEGKTILWVGTKKSAYDVVERVAKKLGMPYVNHRWIGGMLSNHVQVKKSITKLLHYEDVIARASEYPFYTKKEINVINKMVDRLKKNVGGIREMRWPVGAIVIVDVEKESAALKEAAVMGVPVVGIVDTNGDPSLVDYVIPGNDDAVQSVSLLIDYLADAAARGKEKAKDVVVSHEDMAVQEEAAGLLQLQAAGEEEEAASKKKAAKTVVRKPTTAGFKPQQRKVSTDEEQAEAVAAKKKSLSEKRGEKEASIPVPEKRTK